MFSSGILLYYASNMVMPRLVSGAFTRDFGIAFYCTEIRE